MRKVVRSIGLASAIWPLGVGAWEAQLVLEYTMAYNPLLRAYRVVASEYTPSDGIMERVKEHTSVYGRVGAGGTDYLSGDQEPFVMQAGVQISIPLTSTKERREYAMRAVEETRAMDEIRAQVLADIAQLRQQEAELAATASRLEFYEDKSGWLQQRVENGYGDVEELWAIGQKLSDERAAAKRLRALVAAQRYQLAHHAGEKWEVLLSYLKGEGELR